MKIKLFTLILSLCLFNSFNLPARVIETSQMSDILQSVEDSTLVLFDVDETLIHSRTMLGSQKARYFLNAHFKLKNLSLAQREGLFWKVVKAVPVKLVEPYTADLINGLKSKKNVTVLGLTARGCVPHDDTDPKSNFTAHQLKSVNIDFSEHLHLYDLKDHSSKKLVFRDGIIFTEGRLKGGDLKAFLAFAGLSVDKVIFVDDKLEQVNAVNEAMEKKGILCDCYHYTHLVVNPPKFDSETILIQLDHLLTTGQILDDDQADKLKETYVYRTLE